jgi:hypothetical protein
MADDVTFARGVDDPWDEELELLGPLLLHAASGMAITTATAAILLDFFRTTVYSDSVKRRDDLFTLSRKLLWRAAFTALKRDRYLFTITCRRAGSIAAIVRAADD